MTQKSCGFIGLQLFCAKKQEISENYGITLDIDATSNCMLEPKSEVFDMQKEVFNMKKRIILVGLLLVLAIVLAGCADKVPAAPQETEPQENDTQESEIQLATVVYFTEPLDFLAQNGTIADQAYVVFKRTRAGCVDVIDRLAGILQGIDSWSADTAEREELYVDGEFSLSDSERLYWFSYTDNTIFYQIISMDPETEQVNVERYMATLSEADMEYIRSLKDSKDGYTY